LKPHVRIITVRTTFYPPDAGDGQPIADALEGRKIYGAVTGGVVCATFAPC